MFRLWGMKRWLVGVAAVLMVGVVVLGGLWLHASSVESGEAERIEVGDYGIAGAHAAGDVLVLHLMTTSKASIGSFPTPSGRTGPW